MDDSAVGTLVVCGLPESGRLRVQRRDGVKTTLADVYGAPELLYATPAPPDGERGPLSAALPHWPGEEVIIDPPGDANDCVALCIAALLLIELRHDDSLTQLIIPRLGRAGDVLSALAASPLHAAVALLASTNTGECVLLAVRDLMREATIAARAEGDPWHVPRPAAERVVEPHTRVPLGAAANLLNTLPWRIPLVVHHAGRREQRYELGGNIAFATPLALLVRDGHMSILLPGGLNAVNARGPLSAPSCTSSEGRHPSLLLVGGDAETATASPSAGSRAWQEANGAALIEAACSDDAERQLPAVTQIRKLLSIEGSPPLEEVIATGGVSRLVQLMQGGDNPMLQFESAWALTNIASGTSEHTLVVIDNGAIPAFVRLLGSANDDAREQVRGRTLPCRLQRSRPPPCPTRTS